MTFYRANYIENNEVASLLGIVSWCRSNHPDATVATLTAAQPWIVGIGRSGATEEAGSRTFAPRCSSLLGSVKISLTTIRLTHTHLALWTSPHASHVRFTHLLIDFLPPAQAVKWCPAPGCGKAVKYRSGQSRDVHCACGFKFCFACSSAPHAPSTCGQAKTWRDDVMGKEDETKEASADAKWLLEV